MPLQRVEGRAVGSALRTFLAPTITGAPGEPASRCRDLVRHSGEGIALRAVLDRYPQLSRTSEPLEYVDNFNVRMLRSLPVKV